MRLMRLVGAEKTISRIGVLKKIEIKKWLILLPSHVFKIGLIQALSKITSVSFYPPLSLSQTAVIALRSLSAGSPPFFPLSLLSSPFKPPPNSGVYFLSGHLCACRAHYTCRHIPQRVTQRGVETHSHSPRSVAVFQNQLSPLTGRRRREWWFIQTLRSNSTSPVLAHSFQLLTLCCVVATFPDTRNATFFCWCFSFA